MWFVKKEEEKLSKILIDYKKKIESWKKEKEETSVSIFTAAWYDASYCW